MVALNGLLATVLLLMATPAFGATERTTWPGSLVAGIIGVVIVLFVLARWRSKP